MGRINAKIRKFVNAEMEGKPSASLFSGGNGDKVTK